MLFPLGNSDYRLPLWEEIMSSQLARVQTFADATLAARSLAELDAAMAEAAVEFGADYYLMTHHADLLQQRQGLVFIGNYPNEFVEISRLRNIIGVDPVMEACEKTLTGFFWNDVESIITLNEKHHQRRGAVMRTGLGDGFVIPTHIPGEYLGSCHFAVEDGKTIPREHAAALQSIGMFGFEAARRLFRERDGRQAPASRLTQRQRECLVLCAKGKSDVVIGSILQLSPKTVNSYMEEAKRRYGVATRNQLIASALYTSEITYHEVVDVLGCVPS